MRKKFARRTLKDFSKGQESSNKGKIGYFLHDKICKMEYSFILISTI